MTRTEIMQALDEEILRLQQVKRLLQGTRELAPTLESLVRGKQTGTKRVMSAEGRRRIAEAQRRRWAKARGL